MIISPDNLARHELIGLKVEILDTPNRGLAGMGGRVVDETRNMLIIEKRDGELRVPKAGASLVFTLPSGQRVKVAGSILISQPENRINKRIQRSRWKL